MRERLDCAVLLTRCSLDWMTPYLGPHAGGRLHLHPLDTLVAVDDPGAPYALGASVMALRRYDVCLLPVMPATLSWARTSLSLALAQLHTPVMAFTRELTTAGLHDLYQLGVADFLRDPFCSHEARLRIERLLDQRRAAPLQALAAGHYVAETAVDLQGYGAGVSLESAEIDAFAIAAASRCTGAAVSFREAKSRVVERFERAYITAALGRHGGNIAMAARSAQKHRRAFWAIMRKHKINADSFREQAQAVARGLRLQSCVSARKTQEQEAGSKVFPVDNSTGRPLPGR